MYMYLRLRVALTLTLYSGLGRFIPGGIVWSDVSCSLFHQSTSIDCETVRGRALLLQR